MFLAGVWVLSSPPRWMKAGRLFFRLQWVYSFDHLLSSLSSMSSDGSSVLTSPLFAITGSMGQESYYRWLFNSLPASPGSIITMWLAVPFLLSSFPSSSHLSFQPRGVGEPGEKGLAFLRYLLCAGVSPQERWLLNPFVHGEPHVWRGNWPSQVPQLTEARTRVKI